ncbi:MAG: hypothetical protein FWF30_01475 [Coriobacteriia bacterium]|nr:hypothetical protein [Coriobacteriia bacterium]
MSENHSAPEKGQQSVGFFLTAAQEALSAGQARLAIHLYCVAFELDSGQQAVASAPVIDGMRVAWNLACDLGDRSTAESLLNELEPYNTDEQNARDALRLQGLALGQLEEIGLALGGSEARTEPLPQNPIGSEHGSIMKSLIRSADSAAANKQAVQNEKSSSSAQSSDSQPEAVDVRASLSQFLEAVFDGGSQSKPEPDEAGKEWSLDYDHLVGYANVLERMREFGFFASIDTGRREFAEAMAAVHGVYPLALSKPFIFIGPSPSDVAFFAQATANEIGHPLLHIRVELDENGNGSIRMAGAIRHRLFGGGGDYMDMQTPCTVLLEGLDRLQTIFANDQRSSMREFHYGYQSDQPMRRSVRTDFGAYLGELVNRPGVFLIATASNDGPDQTFYLDDLLADIIGPYALVAVDEPDLAERQEIFEYLQSEHSSLVGLDVNALAKISQKLSRFSLFAAVQSALEDAFRSSLRTGTYVPVSQLALLTELGVSYPFTDSMEYRLVEEAAAEAWRREIEDDQNQSPLF